VVASLKHVGDLQALSVSGPCMEFAQGLVKVFLQPKLDYVPNFRFMSLRSQVAMLNFFCPPPFASTEEGRLHVDFSG